MKIPKLPMLHLTVSPFSIFWGIDDRVIPPKISRPPRFDSQGFPRPSDGCRSGSVGGRGCARREDRRGSRWADAWGLLWIR